MQGASIRSLGGVAERETSVAIGTGLASSGRMHLPGCRSAFLALAWLLSFACTRDPADHGVEDSSDDGQSFAMRYPIVLAHGFYATTTNGWSMEHVSDVLRDEGHWVALASVSQFAGTPARARELVAELDEARRAFCRERHPREDAATCFARTKVHIIAHSQAGLDARYAVSKLGYADATASVTTLSSPHRGTPIGDVGLSLLGDERAERSYDRETELAIGSLLEHLIPDEEEPTGLADAFYWLSEARFHAEQRGSSDEQMPDVEGVVYQSWAGVATSDGSLPDVSVCDGKGRFELQRAAEIRGLRDNVRFKIVSGAFDAAEQVPNDGHIPVTSAKFGDFRGCLPADHLDLLGQPQDQVAQNIKRAGFDYAAFYRELSESIRAIEAAVD